MKPLEPTYESLIDNDGIIAGGKVQLANGLGSNNDSSFHWHNELELVFVIEGALQYLVGSRFVTVRENEVICINCGDFHLAANASKLLPVKCLVILVPSKFMKEQVSLLDYPRFDLYAHPEAQQSIIQRMQRIVDVLEHPNHFSVLSINSELYGILYLLFSDCMSHCPDTEGEKDRAIKKIIRYINQNYTHTINVDSIAARFGYQKNYFCRMFKKKTGITYHQYLNHIRLNEALSLAATGQNTLLDCALQAGFATEKTMIDWCKKIYGCTPSQYIRQSNSG